MPAIKELQSVLVRHPGIADLLHESLALSALHYGLTQQAALQHAEAMMKNVFGVQDAKVGVRAAGDGESGFQIQLEHLLNRACEDNQSNTPDFILARFLTGVLTNFNSAVVRRDQWYGATLTPTAAIRSEGRVSFPDFNAKHYEASI
jgi:hypothetical protein